MIPGQLRHRVTLQSQVTTQDALGQPSTAWLDTATVWADVRHESGLSAIKAGADISVVRASIRMRYRAANAGMRVVFGAQTYAVNAVIPDARKVSIDLVCEALQ
jgi:SPP1 family predicted phage head-tail adaptor